MTTEEIQAWIADIESDLKHCAMSGDVRKKLELEVAVLRKVIETKS